MPFGDKFRNRNEITRLPLCLLQFLLIFVQTIFFFLPFIKIPSQSTNINTEHTFSVPTLLFPRTGRCQKWRRKKGVESPQFETRRDAPTADVENQTPSSGFGVAAITRRWKREDLLKRGSLALRGLAMVFSLLAFIVMASNRHGDWKDFDKYEEFRYVLAIAILSTLYTLGQVLRHVHELSTGRQMMQKRTSALIDFFGDQIMSYLLISSASSAVPMTNRMREGADNLFTDSLAASISMQFLAFLALAFSALISGYKLSSQSYI